MALARAGRRIGVDWHQPADLVQFGQAEVVGGFPGRKPEMCGGGRQPSFAATPGVGPRHGGVAQTAPAMLIRGQLQNATGAVTVVAERIGRIELADALRSRDFR